MFDPCERCSVPVDSIGNCAQCSDCIYNEDNFPALNPANSCPPPEFLFEYEELFA